MIKMSLFFGFPPMFLAQMMIHLQNSELPSMPFFILLWFFSNIFVFVSVPWLVLLSFYLFLFFLFSSFRKCVTMTSRNDFIIKFSLDWSVDRYMWPSTLYTKYILVLSVLNLFIIATFCLYFILLLCCLWEA